MKRGTAPASASAACSVRRLTPLQPLATIKAILRPLTPALPGRAVSERNLDISISGACGCSSTRVCAGGTAMPKPSATRSASTGSTLHSMATTRSRTAWVCTRVNSKRNAATMWFCSTGVWLR